MVASAAMATGRGKVILFGEHAVVYGHPALAAGIALGVEAEASPAPENLLTVDPWGVQVAPPGDGALQEPGEHADLAEAFAAAIASLPEGTDGATAVRAEVALPAAAGLGASAALGVAVIGALHERFGVTLSAEALSHKAQAWERVFHGNASGIDNHMAAHGGVARFQKGKPLTPVALTAPIRLLVAHSGEAGSTKEMVARVAEQYARNQGKLEKVFSGIAALVDQGELLLQRGDCEPLGELMQLNQALLSALMVSTARLEGLCKSALAAGAFGAKLTGAGGGGCVIALCPAKQEDRVENALTGEGATTFWTTLEHHRRERTNASA